MAPLRSMVRFHLRWLTLKNVSQNTVMIKVGVSRSVRKLPRREESSPQRICGCDEANTMTYNDQYNGHARLDGELPKIICISNVEVGYCESLQIPPSSPGKSYETSFLVQNFNLWCLSIPQFFGHRKSLMQRWTTCLFVAEASGWTPFVGYNPSLFPGLRGHSAVVRNIDDVQNSGCVLTSHFGSRLVRLCSENWIPYDSLLSLFYVPLNWNFAPLHGRTWRKYVLSHENLSYMTQFINFMLWGL